METPDYAAKHSAYNDCCVDHRFHDGVVLVVICVRCACMRCVSAGASHDRCVHLRVASYPPCNTRAVQPEAVHHTRRTRQMRPLPARETTCSRTRPHLPAGVDVGTLLASRALAAAWMSCSVSLAMEGTLPTPLASSSPAASSISSSCCRASASLSSSSVAPAGARKPAKHLFSRCGQWGREYKNGDIDDMSRNVT